MRRNSSLEMSTSSPPPESHRGSGLILYFNIDGTMCQKSCGTTAQNAIDLALEENGYAPLSVAASHDLRGARIVLPLDTAIGPAQEVVVEAVEDIGFDCAAGAVAHLRDGVPTSEEDRAWEAWAARMRQQDEERRVDAAARKKNRASTSSSSRGDLPSSAPKGSSLAPYILLQVSGMTCSVCSGRVQKTIEKYAGPFLKEANVSAATGKARIDFHPVEECSGGSGMGGVERPPPSGDQMDASSGSYSRVNSSSDFEVEESIENATNFEETAESIIAGIEEAGYGCDLLYLHDGSAGGGGRPSPDRSSSRHHAEEIRSWRRALCLSFALTAPIVALHYGARRGSTGDQALWVQLTTAALSTVVQVLVGARFYVAAGRGFACVGILQGKRPEITLGMDALVVLGTTAAFFYSVVALLVILITSDDTSHHTAMMPTFETSAMLLTFVTLGKYLESHAKQQTSSALQALMMLQPDLACRVKPSSHALMNKRLLESSKPEAIAEMIQIHALETEHTEVAKLQPGDYVVIPAGSRIPADGNVICHDGSGGAGYVDESALSGEPLPVAKRPGDTAYGGTLNQLSTLLLHVTAGGNDTVLSRIVGLVEDAQLSRAPVQAMADSVAGVFVPIVLCLATITFVGWMALLEVHEERKEFTRFYMALMSAISVIVVACPCALGLACPTAIMVGTGVGAANGCLIKGGAALEAANHVTTIIFDKTGTLTTGRAVLGSKISFLQEDDDLLQNLCPPHARTEPLLWLAACAETGSTHPLGAAILNAARSRWGDDPIRGAAITISDRETVPGNGVRCVLSTERQRSIHIRVGNYSFAGDGESNVGDREIEVIRQEGEVGIYVSIAEREDGPWHVVGVLGVKDPIQDNAKACVAALGRMGVEVWMCTGDHETTALSVAKKLGISEVNVCAGVSPEGKGDLVTRLQKRNIRKNEGKKGLQSFVAVVGDGINDAVALARADVGIAIGAGTEVAIEAADVVLVKNNLQDVIVTLHLSKIVFQRIRLNFVWALGYNMFTIPIAAGVLYPFTEWRLPPAFAGLMMAFSSISVVMSSLLLKMYHRPCLLEDGTIKEQMSIIGRCCVTSPYFLRINDTRFGDTRDEGDGENWNTLELV
mmetsp:Transcript_27261/g.62579  ORF Transcript_27261/g.62579 Transcript_27261/m.62579 type:complete len:1114 (-) Transcript_27261:134-3475(-)